MPTGHRKLQKLPELFGKLRKCYRKAIGRSSTGLQSRQIMVTIRRHELAYPFSVKDNERRRQRRFQLTSATTLHIRSSRSTRARNLVTLGVECLYTPRIAIANQTQEGNVECPSTREDTNSQRPTSANTFRRLKLTFWRLKFYRYNAHDNCLPKRNYDDFRTESERLAYRLYGRDPYTDLGLICNIPFSGWGTGGGADEVKFQTAIYLGNG